MWLLGALSNFISTTELSNLIFDWNIWELYTVRIEAKSELERLAD